jgi:arsenate reductase (glutaredoxin)
MAARAADLVAEADMITILHNPRCSTSRAVLAAIREAGYEPQIVDYQKTPLPRPSLVALLVALELSPRDIMRRKEAIYAELALDDSGLSDNQLLDAIEANPVLIERPIVITDKGARLCRPIERLSEIL